MSWSDPARRFEPAEDVTLRAELGDLLGFTPEPRPEANPSPELVALAHDLQHEALRRRRLERRRPTWGLLAAAVLPLVAATAALGLWGHQNRVRAEALAAQTHQKNQELERMAQAHRAELARERGAREQLTLALAKVDPKAAKKPYLVIPVEPVQAPDQGQLRVGARPGQ